MNLYTETNQNLELWQYNVYGVMQDLYEHSRAQAQEHLRAQCLGTWEAKGGGPC